MKLSGKSLRASLPSAPGRGGGGAVRGAPGRRRGGGGAAEWTRRRSEGRAPGRASAPGTARRGVEEAGRDAARRGGGVEAAGQGTARRGGAWRRRRGGVEAVA